MPVNPIIEAVWQRYCAIHPAETDRPMPEAWGFGNSAAMADELGALGVQGIKTATCSLLWEYEAENEPLPRAGDLSIILDGAGCPLCIIRTTDVEIKRFNQVDEQFAFDEGEGDRSLDYWRRAHQRFFARRCTALNREFSDTIPLVCERFKVVFSE